MIRSLLDNDLYKFTMQQAVHALYPRAEAQYVFINRGGTPFPGGFAERLADEIRKMEALHLSDDELAYTEKACYFLTPVYLDFLRHYRYDSSEVRVTLNDGDLQISIEGPWYRTILWEVPLMALASELYFEMTAPPVMTREEQRANNTGKASRLRDAGVNFADFGTRRRFSAQNHERVIGDLLSVDGNTLVGTSNVHFARQFNITPIGTLAHEWCMFHAALNGYRLANKTALDAWTDVFHGSLGIALTDTYTTDVFLQSFDSVKARLFDGVRQDSGDPLAFADKMLEHYRRLRINPLTKTIVFSDGLSTQAAIEVRRHCKGKINTSFGIGTYLTNDVGPEALNMVIKMSACRADSAWDWIPTVKLSDVEGKHTGVQDEIDLCIRILQRRAL